MSEHQSAVLQQCTDNRAEVVAASRFFNNDRVTTSALIEALVEKTKPVAAQRHVLCLQDTSEVNYNAHAGRLKASDPELGPVTNGRDVGFFLHPSLVLDAQTGFALGYADIYLWNRRWHQPDKHERHYKSLPIEQKESYRWIAASLRTKAALAEAAHRTIIADREGDIFEEFATVPDDQTDVLIRSRCDRRIETEAGGGLLYAYVAALSCQGHFELKIKGRPGRRARRAQLDVRFGAVSLQKPQTGVHAASLPAQVQVWAIEIRESPKTVPKGEEPILWRLLTTHRVETLEQALQIALWYSWRWWIEQLFRLLKSEGLRLESSQLERGSALKKLCVLSLEVALALLQLVTERDGDYGAPVSVVFTAKEAVFLSVLQRRYEGKTAKQRCRHGQGSLAWAAWVIGRLGGWKGYARASPPGPITMRRGLDRFMDQYAGWLLAQHGRINNYAGG